jgi:hypothetical protein
LSRTLVSVTANRIASFDMLHSLQPWLGRQLRVCGGQGMYQSYEARQGGGLVGFHKNVLF